MKKLLVLMVVGSGIAFCQQQLNNVGAIVFSNSLPSSPKVTAQVVGGVGGGTYYYWIVANFPSGLKGSPSSPAIVANVPNALTVSNYINVSWSSVSGASSYDVLRTMTPYLPNGAATIAVVKATSGTSYSDIGASLTSYTVATSPSPSTCTSYYDVIDDSPPQLIIPCLASAGGTVTSVGFNTGTTGLTVNGGTSATITTNGTFLLGGILGIANGGNGTATPSLVNGTNTTVSGSWPSQSVNIASIPYTDVNGGTQYQVPFFDVNGNLTSSSNFKYGVNSTTGISESGITSPAVGYYCSVCGGGFMNVGSKIGYTKGEGYIITDINEASWFLIGYGSGDTYPGGLALWDETNNKFVWSTNVTTHNFFVGNITNPQTGAGANFEVAANENGHIYAHGTTPTLVGCPASSTIYGNDHIGTVFINGASSGATCQMRFATPIPDVNTPTYGERTICILNPVTASALTANDVEVDTSPSTEDIGWYFTTSAATAIRYSCSVWQ